jgi:EAL domain-containing protein (putative c-di-GMP-specific phosphodiesterase class I)
MKTGGVIGAEALIRWQHPQRGVVGPGEFLHYTEGHPIAIELGDWVICTALAQLAEWHDQGLRIPISVNISAQHLLDEDFVPRLRQHLAAHPEVQAQYLELEVLETSALEDMPRVTKIMQNCLRLGVKFALDDFGTGYSSLTYLKRLPADMLKIDQSFVRTMLENPEDLAIVNGVMGLATAFRRDIIAEGVETEAHGELLLLMGCEQGQGYGIAKPMPPGDFPGWAATWRPYPSWAAWQSRDFRREDLPILFADVELRAWIRDIESYLDDGDVLPPLMNERQCLLGRWYHSQGKDTHGHAPEFEAIDPMHHRLHELVDELHELYEQGLKAEARARLGELHALRDELTRMLKALPRGRRDQATN